MRWSWRSHQLAFSLAGFRTTSPFQRTYKNYRVRKERNCEYGTVQLRSLAWFRHDIYLTKLICTPRPRWAPEHSRHKKMPYETEAHWGFLASQSAQVYEGQRRWEVGQLQMEIMQRTVRRQIIGHRPSTVHCRTAILPTKVRASCRFRRSLLDWVTSLSDLSWRSRRKASESTDAMLGCRDASLSRSGYIPRVIARPWGFNLATFTSTSPT